ncbi:MAG: RNA polymerase sigma factor [Gemmatimonadota bacterium]
MMADTTLELSNEPNPADDQPADAELVAQLRAGSREALATLFRRHAASLHGLAFRLTGSRAEADDVVQDVFVGLRRALAPYEERGRFASWLRKLAARTALMRVRRQRLEATLPMRELAGDPPTLDTGAVIDRMAVRAALEELPEGRRRVFLLREVEGYSHAEIAGLLEISVAASRVRLHRAWKLLRQRAGGAP